MARRSSPCVAQHLDVLYSIISSMEVRGDIRTTTIMNTDELGWSNDGKPG